MHIFLVEEGKSITKNGRNHAGNQQYLCHHCGRYFIETKNTPLYHSCLSHSKVILIAKHSKEKTSVRGVYRVLDHHRDTISKYFQLIGQYAEILNDHFIRGVSAGDCEFDEIRSFNQYQHLWMKVTIIKFDKD